EKVLHAIPELQYDPIGRILWWSNTNTRKTENAVAVICAGTSDLPTFEECCATLKLYGHHPKRYIDIGVAGLHRMLQALPEIRKHRVLIVIAGMEGALPSVLAGLVTAPVIAVPTNIGYGANQDGITTLLAMLSSCASGIATVNIGNGYGAACVAARILEQA
ncbi:MAG: nickel pincer cofactor biosynthesis protein LarB, partial [Myxococcota bacterium]|nr:nickel pincer cofactor biosynthesis protein LarB [Myxococcota bacterium]